MAESKYTDPKTNPMIRVDPTDDAEPPAAADDRVPLGVWTEGGAQDKPDPPRDKCPDVPDVRDCMEDQLEADLRTWLKRHDALLTDFGEYAQLDEAGKLIIGPGNHLGRPLDLRTAPADFVMRLWGSLRDRIAHEEGRP